jgi:hypothetical protein
LTQQNFADCYQEALDILDSACDELRTDLGSPSSSMPRTTERKSRRPHERSTLSRELEELNSQKETDDEDAGERDDTFDMGEVFSDNHDSLRIFDRNSGRLSPLPQMNRQATVSLMDIYKLKSLRLSPHNHSLSDDASNGQTEEHLRPGSIEVNFPAGLKHKKLVVCPLEGSMVTHSG